MGTVGGWKRFVSQSGVVSLLIGLGVGSNAFVDIVIAAKFGLGAQLDAFFIAYTIPLMISAVILSASNSALVPCFARNLQENGRDSTWALFSTIFNVGLVAGLVIFAIGILTARSLVSVVAPGADRPTIELAAQLSRLLSIVMLFTGPIGVMRAFLNTHKLFIVPAMPDLIRGVTVLLVVLATSTTWGITSVAWGFALGSLLQFAILATVLFKELGSDYRFRLDWRHPSLAEAKRLLIAPFIDQGLTQGILVAERVIGSFLSPGSVSALSYGHRLSAVIVAVLFGGVETVTLPSLSGYAASRSSRDLRRAQDILVASLRLLTILSIPVTLAVASLSVPITGLFFERGAFDRAATLLTGSVLGLYAFSIPFVGYLLLLRNYFYAATNASRLILLSLWRTVSFVILAPGLAGVIGIRGVAFAFSAGASLASGIGYLFLKKEMPTLPLKPMLVLMGKVIIASMMMSLALRGVWGGLGHFASAPGKLYDLIRLAGAGLVGIAVLGTSLILLRVEETSLTLCSLVRSSGLRLILRSLVPRSKEGEK
jgi:putative peptidoglycan lipid II flippase